MQKIIDRIECENGKLYADIDGKRILLARCEAEIEVIEESKDIKVLGSKNCKVRKRHFTIVLCDDMEHTRVITIKLISKMKNYVLGFDIQRTDGIFESVYIDNLIPSDIEIDGVWKFYAEDIPERLREIMQV